jgi:putative transcriptional regulator
MKLELNDNFKGKCLVAAPSMRDDMFTQSVVYITEHSSINGAVGVIINKNITDQSASSADFGVIAKDVEWGNIPLFIGGPVELTSGFILHQLPDDSGLFLTGSLNKIVQLAHDKRVKPLMLTAGYCMWETLQLEREVRLSNWLVVNATTEHLLMDTAPQDRYAEALRLAGVNNLANFDFSGGGNA